MRRECGEPGAGECRWVRVRGVMRRDPCPSLGFGGACADSLRRRDVPLRYEV